MSKQKYSYQPFKDEEDPSLTNHMEPPDQVMSDVATGNSYPMQNMTTFISDAPPQPRWSWAHVITAVISVFCCYIFGVIATVMSVLAYVDHKVGDYGRSRKKKNLALGLAIAGIIIGSVLLILTIVLTAIGVQNLNALMAGMMEGDDFE